MKEQAIAVALTVAERAPGGQGACRIHGGGFAGTIQAFVAAGYAGKLQGGDGERPWRRERKVLQHTPGGRHNTLAPERNGKNKGEAYREMRSPFCSA